mgnify:CR=1 FL=1
MGVNVPTPNPGTDGMSAKAATTTQFSSKTVGPIGNTTYVLVENTMKVDGVPASISKLSVSAVVKDINETSSNATPSIKAFGSMNDLMSAIKAQYGEDIKAVTSYVNDKGELELRVETFADVGSRYIYTHTNGSCGLIQLFDSLCRSKIILQCCIRNIIGQLAHAAAAAASEQVCLVKLGSGGI